MRKILLASVGVMVMSAGSVYAACIPTPSCSSLGYESLSSCEGGIKCPFGNAWNCTLANKITEIERIIEENSGGESCQLGSIFYSDRTCSSKKLDKTPIGIVIYVNKNGGGQVMALKSIGNYQWANMSTDYDKNIYEITDVCSLEDVATDVQSCQNTAAIIKMGDKAYDAAWAAYNYKTAGTSVGEWCLPAVGVLESLKNNISLINDKFILAGGSAIGGQESVFSSSEYDGDRAWYYYFNELDYGIGIDKSYSQGVRPVLEF